MIGPKMTNNIDKIIGFSNGEANINDIELENATPDFKKPSVIGMVEQEQNGVSAPNAAPNMLPATLPVFPSTRCIVRGETYTCNTPTNKLTTTKRSTSSAVMMRKNSPAETNVSARLI